MTNKLPVSSTISSFVRPKILPGHPHCVPPSGHSSLCFSPPRLQSGGLYSRGTDSSSPLRSAAASSAAIAAIRSGASGAAANALVVQHPPSSSQAMSAGSRSSLVVDGSVDSWARPLIPEGVRRSSLKADSYSTIPSIAETCTPAGVHAHVPVIIDVGPIAATVADVQASVNGDQGLPVASSSVQMFESWRSLEELSSIISSVTSSAHSQSHSQSMMGVRLHSTQSMDSATMSGGAHSMNSMHSASQHHRVTTDVAARPASGGSGSRGYPRRSPRSAVATAIGAAGPHLGIDSVLSESNSGETLLLSRTGTRVFCELWQVPVDITGRLSFGLLCCLRH